MRKFEASIKLQEVLHRQLVDSLQGDVTSTLRFYSESVSVDAMMRSNQEGLSMKVGEGLLGNFYKLCTGVMEKFGITGGVDFYISSTPEINAYSYYSQVPEKPHMIEISSRLYNLLDEDEKRYVIGHELGHLINNDAEVNTLMQFLYPDEEDGSRNVNCPPFIIKRHELYQNVSELGADIFGFLACENLEACVTAMYKMSSGLMLNNLDVTVEALMEENDRRLDYFLHDNGFSMGDHPVDPIRVKALERYATAKTQKAYNTGMGELLDLLQTFSYSEEDNLMADFVAAAGHVMLNGKKSKQEISTVYYHLAEYTLYPVKHFKEVGKLDYTSLMKESAKKILENDPLKDDDLLNYIMDIAFADCIIEQEEFDMIYKIGEMIGIEGPDVTNIISDNIRGYFRPRADSLL